jgi:hypothetical protein
MDACSCDRTFQLRMKRLYSKGDDMTGHYQEHRLLLFLFDQ